MTKVLDENEDNLLLVEWEPIHDGWGYIGYSWRCTECLNIHMFTSGLGVMWCDNCGAEHWSDWEDN